MEREREGGREREREAPQACNGGLVGVGDTVEGVGSGLGKHARVERLLGKLVVGWVT